MDIAGLLLLVQLLEDEKKKAAVVPMDPVLAGTRPSSGVTSVSTPKPIKKVDDTQVRPRGRFGL